MAGDNDCNKHRARLTEQYLSKLQVTLIVDEVMRSTAKEDHKHVIDDA